MDESNGWSGKFILSPTWFTCADKKKLGPHSKCIHRTRSAIPDPQYQVFIIDVRLTLPSIH